MRPQVLSAAMMCTYSLNEPGVAKRLEAAVEKALEDGYRTKDIMSEGMKEVGCRKMGDILVENIQASA